MSPSIIFIDEIDSVGKDRANLNSDEREATLNQLLVEMDGFSSNSGVIVIGATNRIDVLDSALLRPGRFDRRIFIELPNIQERKQILNLYLKDKQHSLNIDEVAKITAGFSPAAIETLINEAALNAIRENKKTIDISDIHSVKERVIFGKKPVAMLNDKERRIQSQYQAAKALVAHWLGFKIDRVSLLISININKEEAIVSRENLLNRVKVLISGSVYLEQKYSDIFNIGIEDRNKADSILSKIVINYALAEFEREEDILHSIITEIESTLTTLEKSIEVIADRLYSNETVTAKQIKEELNELF
jgi:ATP-dependent Zn protease